MTTPNPISILYMEDDAGLARLLQKRLERHGYRVTIARDGREGLDLYAKTTFDVVVVDQAMPGQQGLDVIRSLSGQDYPPAIVMITGHGDEQTAVEAMKLGASDYLVKDADNRYLNLLPTVIEQAHRHRQWLQEKQQAEAELRRQNRELLLLNRIIAAAAAQTSPDDLLSLACRELARAFNLPCAVAALLNDAKTELRITAQYLHDDSRMPPLDNVIPFAGTAISRYFLSVKGPVTVHDAANDPRLAPLKDILRRRNIVSLLILPLIVDGQPAGGIALANTGPRRFSTPELNLAWSVADQAAGVLARTRMAHTHRRLITAIEQSAESIMITDPGGNIIYVNPTFERTTGYTRAEALGRNPRLLKSGKQGQAFYEELWQTITAGHVWRGRFINKKKDGALYTEEATITPVRNEAGEIINYVAVKRDISHELQLEEQYYQAQKMDAIGRLTGGIAHDFNNLLTAINGFAELLRFRLPPDTPHLDLLDKILHAGGRATDLINQLMAFSRKQVIQPRVVDLNKIVTDMSSMLHRIIGEDIQMKTLLTPTLWPVKADPTQLEQVIINLAVNARDAMPHGGWLTIKTTNVVLTESDVAGRPDMEPGEYALLTFSDTGTGMSKAVQERIFEPFFTTKEKGKGTGLGLATVYGIIKQSQGDIQVESEEGRRTTFKIYLPRVAGPAGAPDTEPDTDNIPAGSETILLVEDEATVREMVKESLAAQGYTVLEAPHGQEALRLSARYQPDIHLLITDVVMPGMSGEEIFRQLSQLRPNLKILFISGYSGQAISARGIFQPELNFLQKPFTATALLKKVRQVLNAPLPAS